LTRAKISAESVNLIPGYDAIGTAGGRYTFDPEAAAHALDFIEGLCHYAKGSWAGKPFRLLPWQVILVSNLYGWLDSRGLRRYRQCGVWVPRKNGKTELCAPLGLYHLLGDSEPTPEVVSIAADRAQAKLVFERAKAMVRAEPELSSRLEVYAHKILCPVEGGSWLPMSSDAPTAHGLHISFAICDEVHAMHNRRELWEAIQTSMGARTQPLLLSITTAGTRRESLEADLFSFSCKVRDGILDTPSYLPVIYSLDELEDWRDEKLWARANPSLGVTFPIDFLRGEAKRAHDQPAFETAFRTLHLNQHVSSDLRWLRMADWDLCESEILDTDLALLPCYLGFDLGEVSDLTSLTAVWMGEGVYYLRSWSYAPEDRAELRQAAHRVPYLDWARDGFLTLTPGNVTDYGFMRSEILRIAGANKVVAVGYDPANAGGISQQLEADGLKLFRVPQSYAQLSTPTKRFEAAVTSHVLRHEKNPLFAWALSNVTIELDSNQNIRPSKRRSGDKIDPVVSAIIALGVALDHSSVIPSPYSDRGFLML